MLPKVTILLSYQRFVNVHISFKCELLTITVLSNYAGIVVTSHGITTEVTTTQEITTRHDGQYVLFIGIPHT